MARHYYPALRGRFGDWAFYSLLMSVKQLTERVKFAEEIHNIRGSKKLSSLIQRELDNRAPEIAEYLRSNEDRFFNSLVVAVYGGSPNWHEFDIKLSDNIDDDDLDVTAKYSIGYLSFDNSEHLFALDGQHRLAGLTAAMKKNKDFGNEELSVIIISHQNTKTGLRRTRKLFTTLNKTAIPVSKRQIIALDETHVSAITTRRLVEEHEKISKNDLIDIEGKTANLPSTDMKHITNIINVYDTLNILFKGIFFNKSESKFRDFVRIRPKDEILEQ